MGSELTILFQNREQCCGCGACVQKCPKSCVSFKADAEGFLYPSINIKNCVNCGICVSVCPFHAPMEAKDPINSFASFHKDDKIRQKSSSGGVFSMLAKSVLDEGGAVFGAMFDDSWNVVHGCVETVDELPKLQGSKYVQSFIGKSYQEAEQFVKEGRQVLFSGTPCHIAGLRKYLGKDYENLITVDCICHGVPSPKLWKWYLGMEKRKGDRIVGISFRNKDNGWKRFNIAIDYANGGSSVRTYHREDPYMMAFLDNMSLRPSCSSCQSKSGRSHSDITLADFWNVDKVVDGIDDDKGVSLVLANTPAGMEMLKSASDGVFQEVDFKRAIQFNKAWEESFPMNPNREKFYSSYHKHGKDFSDFVAMNPGQKVALSKRLKRNIKAFLNLKR